MNINEVSEEIKQILTEAEFNARWSLIEAYHQVGQLILELEGERTQVVHSLAVKVGRAERTLWYAVKFAERYKDVNDLPEGKNVSWNRVVKNYLTDSKSKEEICEHIPIVICSICKTLLDKDGSTNI